MNRPLAEPPPADTDAAEVPGHRYRRRVRFEVIFASIWLAIGIFALPAAIFAVGGALLGPYGDTDRLGRFYGDFFGDLAEPSLRAWALALGPLALISILRLVFAGAGRGPEAPKTPPTEPAAAPRRGHEEARRVEPRVSAE
ncbi:MAG TPA: hypothetical protein VJT80_23595 [Steroidobacteraceae bacterium]|nr:hypothetical protein [Steroidobacteraceae bacterium]